MSHPKFDHFGGLIDVIKNYNVGVFIGTGRTGTANSYQELVRNLKEKNIKYIFLESGDRFDYADHHFKIIWPEAYANLAEELNSGSLVILYEYNGQKALLTGDIGSDFDDELAEAAGDIDLLKVAHHGSKYSTSERFLGMTKPETAIISVGKNSYGHPTKELLERLQTIGARILRTNLDGTIKIKLRDL